MERLALLVMALRHSLRASATAGMERRTRLFDPAIVKLCEQVILQPIHIQWMQALLANETGAMSAVWCLCSAAAKLYLVVRESILV